MIKYIIKRLIHMIPVMFIISMVLFGIIKATPGDPVGMKMDPRMTAEQKAAERERLGLNKPPHLQYIDWLGRTIKGDFGDSSTYSQPVRNIIGTFIWNTFILNLGVFIITFLIAIPLGIYTANHKDGWIDKIVTVLSYAGISFPSFFISLILIYIFSVNLNIFPIGGMVTPGMNAVGFAKARDIIHHMILPTIALVIITLPSTLRYVRMNMLSAIKQDYIRTARAKGLSEKVVIYKHAFRNALLNIVTLLGMQLVGLFAGASILEKVFSWPGIGGVLLESVTSRDYNLMMAIMIMFALLTLLGNLLADIGYALVDPRIKVE
ncbi:MAG: ABC transporter permease [Cellulosilyticaceae bacterium]